MPLYIGRLGECYAFRLSLYGKSDSVRLCVRAGEATLCERVKHNILNASGSGIKLSFSVLLLLREWVFFTLFLSNQRHSECHLNGCMRTSPADRGVLHRFYRVVDRFVDIWLCVARVLSCCWYLLVLHGFIVLMIFDCVSHVCYCVVGIWLCVAGVLSFCW